MSAARFRRAGLGGPAALAIALAATPLAAQTAPGAETQQEAAEPAPASADDGADEPFVLEVAGGDEQSVAAHPVGEVLPADRRICLGPAQVLTVSANGEQVAYAGPGCLEPRRELAIPAEVYAGSHVWFPLSEESPGWSYGNECSAIVVDASGPSAESFVRGRLFAADETIALEAADRVTLLGASGTRVLAGPGTYRVPCDPRLAATRGFSLTRGGERRARVGAVRSAPDMISGLAAQRLIATRGTAGALKKFPRGTLIGSPQKVCLAAGDRLTVAARSGARMTFAGPGCGQRLQGADDDNTPAVSPG